jgi:hypothetical protein
MRNAVVVIVLALGLGACGGGLFGGATEPSEPAVTVNGNYTGTAVDSLFGTGSLQLTLAQSDATLSGTYASQYPVAGVQGGGGVSGVVENSQAMTATLQPSDTTTCPYQLTGTIRDEGATISGTYASFNCTSTVTGTFIVTRQ